MKSSVFHPEFAIILGALLDFIPNGARFPWLYSSRVGRYLPNSGKMPWIA